MKKIEQNSENLGLIATRSLPKTLAFMAFVFVMLFSTTSFAQLAESFETAGAPTDTTPAGWTQGRISGTLTSFPNGFKRAGVGSIQAIGAHPTPVPAAFQGNNVIKFNNRTANYPALSGAPAGEEAYLASRPLDWTGRLGAGGTVSLRFYRDNSVTGTVNTVNDRIEVYMNTTPGVAGATLLTELATGATAIPRSYSLTIPNVTGWQLLTYNIPASAPKWDTCSTVYVVIRAISAGGNNMFIDSVSAPHWPTNMVATHAEVIYNNKSTTGPGITNNVILGLKIITKGSLLPVRLDSIQFLPAGCTNFLGDVSAARCYYTHDTSYWYTTGTQIPKKPGFTLGQLGFGYLPCGTTPIAFTLRPGTENYVWLVYDIAASPPSTPGNFVDADLNGFWSGTICGPAYPGGIGGIAMTDLTGGMEIDISYTIPVMSVGTSWPGGGYYNNDYVSAVEWLGDYGTAIDNWYHYISVGTPCPADCDRFSPHPPDYTLFNAQNNGINRNRLVKVLAGKGIRNGTLEYTLRIQCGTWFSSNYVTAFIDWNKDGDFTDTYTGTGGNINEWCNLTGGLGSNRTGTSPGIATPLVQANINAPFAGAHAIYGIHIPLPGDGVINVGGAGGPAKIGNVRLRVREVYATSSFTAFSGHTFGETEDYTIQVLDNCPPAAANISKWLGVTSRWADVANWCPAIPSLDDIAYIPGVGGSNYKFPTIDSGTVAVCRSLKIENGASVNVNCQYSTGLVNDPKGSLRVADSLIIGVGTITASSQLKVISNFSGKYTIPAATAIPPLGNGIYTNSVFQNSTNQKLQVAYSASELYSVFGWRPGDMIDSIRVVFKMTPGVTGTWNNFRIAKYETPNPMAWVNPFAVDADMCVRSGYPVGTVGPTYVLGTATSGTTITLNNINQPNTGTSFYTFSVSSFTWNGGNLVLSFEWFGSAAPGGAYMNYYEGSATYNVFVVKCNAGAVAWNSATSGYALSGYNATLQGVANGGIIGTTTPNNYCASNLRPRLEFFLRRPYTRFPITVGKAFVNNNPYIKVGGSVAGDSGFVAGKSKVTFDPTIRGTVNSPGLASPTPINSWNPTWQSVSLSTTTDTMSITSGRYALGGTGYVTGTASTVFNELEIKANSNIALPAATVKQRFNTYADTLTMTSGELNLNRRMFTLKNGYAVALASNGGWIRSEDNSNGNIQSIFRWKTVSNDDYSVPFGKASTSIFPLKVYPEIAGGMGDIDMATYGTTASTNVPFPTAPIAVTTMNDTLPVATVATPWTVDRFWYIRSYGTSKSNNDSVVFAYPETEGTSFAFYKTGVMKAQRYSKSTATGNWGWNHWSFFEGQRDWSNGIISNVKAVSGTGSGTIPGPNLGQASDSGFIWTIVQWGAGQAPLPIELISFNAKQVDQKVKLWWNVQSETSVAKYVVERTQDYSFITEVASQLPVGPSTAVLYYEDWDMNPKDGIQYYRLITYSVDGTKQFSQYVPVSFGNANFAIISGVNSTDALFVYDKNASVRYTVQDMNGKIIVSGTVNSVSGTNALSLPDLSGGMYILTLFDDSRIVNSRFVK